MLNISQRCFQKSSLVYMDLWEEIGPLISGDYDWNKLKMGLNKFTKFGTLY